MMNCAEAARLLSDRLNHPPGIRARVALRLHLAMCVGCQRYARQLALMRAWLRSSTIRQLDHEGNRLASLGPVARDRIQTLLRDRQPQKPA